MDTYLRELSGAGTDRIRNRGRSAYQKGYEALFAHPHMDPGCRWTPHGILAIKVGEVTGGCLPRRLRVTPSPPCGRPSSGQKVMV